jgi:hypothetical protein
MKRRVRNRDRVETGGKETAYRSQPDQTPQLSRDDSGTSSRAAKLSPPLRPSGAKKVCLVVLRGCANNSAAVVSQRCFTALVAIARLRACAAIEASTKYPPIAFVNGSKCNVLRRGQRLQPTSRHEFGQLDRTPSPDRRFRGAVTHKVADLIHPATRPSHGMLPSECVRSASSFQYCGHGEKRVSSCSNIDEPCRMRSERVGDQGKLGPASGAPMDAVELAIPHGIDSRRRVTSSLGHLLASADRGRHGLGRRRFQHSGCVLVVVGQNDDFLLLVPSSTSWKARQPEHDHGPSSTGSPIKRRIVVNLHIFNGAFREMSPPLAATRRRRMVVFNDARPLARLRLPMIFAPESSTSIATGLDH